MNINSQLVDAHSAAIIAANAALRPLPTKILVTRDIKTQLELYLIQQGGKLANRIETLGIEEALPKYLELEIVRGQDALSFE